MCTIRQLISFSSPRAGRHHTSRIDAANRGFS